jgi:hypothetical protein
MSQQDPQQDLHMPYEPSAEAKGELFVRPDFIPDEYGIEGGTALNREPVALADDERILVQLPFPDFEYNGCRIAVEVGVKDGQVEIILRTYNAVEVQPDSDFDMGWVAFAGPAGWAFSSFDDDEDDDQDEEDEDGSKDDDH